MNILHIYKDYYPVLGGIENHIKVLAEAQAAAGHYVSVLAASPTAATSTQTINGVHVILAGRLATLASTPISPAMFAWVARLKADIAHLHFPHPPGETANLLFHPAQRTVITYHSDIVRQKGLLRFYQPILWQVLKHADRILPTSPTYIDTSPYLRRVRNKCTVVPLGVDLERFEHVAPEQTAGLRARLALPQDKPMLVFVGRLRYYKGLDDLLWAMSQLPQAHLLVVGDGPMKGEWQTLTNKLNLKQRVTFAGEVPDEDLPACYRLGDLFVLPANARAEAFGTVIIEAMASRLPVVCTDVGTGTSWVNQHQQTGLVVRPHDPAALAQAINSLLADPAQRLAMGQAARQRAVNEFSQPVMVERVEQAYRDVLAFSGQVG